MSCFPSSGAQSEEDGRGCRLNHRHLRHFISPTLFFPGMGECVCGTGELAYILPRSLIPSLFPSLPPSDDLLLYEFIHLSAPLHLVFVTLLLGFFPYIYSLSTCLSLSLSHTALSHSFFFGHGRGRENEQPESSERRGWRKEKREQGGELCPAEEARDGCSTCRDSVRCTHCTRSSCPCDGSPRQELSEQEQNAKEKKRHTPNGAAAERKTDPSCFFSSSWGAKLSFVQTCTVDFSALTISDPPAPSLPPSFSPLPSPPVPRSWRHSLGHFRSNCVEFSGLRRC